MKNVKARSACLVFCLQALAIAQLPLTWRQAANTGPIPRTAPAMAFDSSRGKSVLFGGFNNNYNNNFGDTWEWDGSTWVPQLFASGPTARYDHKMAYDSQRHRTVMFGGINTTLLGDTWEWSGAAWTQVSTSGPSARSSPGLCYDSVRGKTVLFGGYSTSFQNDTWEWNGVTWTQTALTGLLPARRFGLGLVYDSNRAKTVMFGGFNNTDNYLSDTWCFDGVTWAQLVPSGTQPSARYCHAMSYDSNRGKVVIFGGFGGTFLGDTWELLGSNWLEVIITGPNEIIDPAMAYDSNREMTVLYGGLGTLGYPTETWEWQGTSLSTAYGTGCGSPPLTLTQINAAYPTMNTTAKASLTNIPGSLAFISIGLSNINFGPFQLPITLVGLGMPGCDLLQSVELAALPTITNGAGSATFHLPLPNYPALQGMHLYIQGWANAQGFNQGGAIASNGLDWRIGF